MRPPSSPPAASLRKPEEPSTFAPSTGFSIGIPTLLSWDVPGNNLSCLNVHALKLGCARYPMDLNHEWFEDADSLVPSSLQEVDLQIPEDIAGIHRVALGYVRCNTQHSPLSTHQPTREISSPPVQPTTTLTQGPRISLLNRGATSPHAPTSARTPTSPAIPPPSSSPAALPIPNFGNRRPSTSVAPSQSTTTPTTTGRAIASAPSQSAPRRRSRTNVFANNSPQNKRATWRMQEVFTLLEVKKALEVCQDEAGYVFIHVIAGNGYQRTITHVVYLVPKNSGVSLWYEKGLPVEDFSPDLYEKMENLFGDIRNMDVGGLLYDTFDDERTPLDEADEAEEDGTRTPLLVDPEQSHGSNNSEVLAPNTMNTGTESLIHSKESNTPSLLLPIFSSRSSALLRHSLAMREEVLPSADRRMAGFYLSKADEAAFREFIPPDATTYVKRSLHGAGVRRDRNSEAEVNASKSYSAERIQIEALRRESNSVAPTLGLSKHERRQKQTVHEKFIHSPDAAWCSTTSMGQSQVRDEAAKDSAVPTNSIPVAIEDCSSSPGKKLELASEVTLANASGAGPATKDFPLPKFVISLSRKEIEEDFLKFKGSKIPKRPKRRPKAAERAIYHCTPGTGLSDVSMARYTVKEKRNVKGRLRGLKAMESEETDSE
ncbi:hypothetical protein L7F22_067002 [Adiantum nelumboides]|nr:hypothetical protein [Adiantum nelumboides]